MKRLSMFSMITVFLIMAGALLVHNMKDIHTGSINTPVPEGYSSPGKLIDESGTTSQNQGIRINKLDIGENIPKYYNNFLELVAFAPGSGWVKIKTRDGISPTLSFNNVGDREVQRFNQFSKSIGLPIRVKLAGRTLQVYAQETEKDSIYFAGQADEKTGSGFLENKGFFHTKRASRLVMRRNQEGNVILVAIKDTGNKTEYLVKN